jgi:hypothetical protein
MKTTQEFNQSDGIKSEKNTSENPFNQSGSSPPFSKVPQDLKNAPRWVCWRFEDRKGKLTKVPLNPTTGKPADVTKQDTWNTFDTVVQTYRACGGDVGVGFVLGNGIVGIDLDKCRDPNTGVIEPWATKIVREIGSYAEVSPSGTGIHILLMGKLKPGRRRIDKIEVYDKDRYFCVTGNHIPDSPEYLLAGGSSLKNFYDKYFMTPESERKKYFTASEDLGWLDKEPARDGETPTSTLSDAEVIRRATESNEKFKALFDNTDNSPSPSEGDLGLCNILAFWCAKDKAQMDRIFRSSKRMRPKWDEQHGANTYGETTIEKAVTGTNKVFGNSDPMDRNFDTSSMVTLETLNEKYFVIPIGGRTRVCWEEYDSRMRRYLLGDMSFSDFRNLYLNKMVLAGDKYQPIGNVWLKSPDRKTFEKVVMMPKGECPSNYYNLWRGFSVEPKQGSWKLLERHIREVICQGIDEHYQYFVRWMASSVQNPDGQGWAAVVLRGDRGSGKGLAAQYFGRLFGQHFMHITNPMHLTGHFNSHLRDCLFLFVDEAYWAGDPSAEGVLKGLVTEEEIVIEAKGKDPERYPNRLHILMATNNDWAVPAGGKERRFFVLDIDDSMIGNKDYFDRLVKEMNEDGRSALLYDLLRMDLSTFDVRKVPNTEALTDQKIHSFDPVTQYWFMRLSDGTMPSYPEPNLFDKNMDPNRPIYVDEWQDVKADDLYRDYNRVMKEAGVSRRGVETKFGMTLKSLLPSGSYKKYQKQTTSGLDKDRPYYYMFPSLRVCRDFFEKKICARVNWEENRGSDEKG